MNMNHGDKDSTTVTRDVILLLRIIVSSVVSLISNIYHKLKHNDISMHKYPCYGSSIVAREVILWLWMHVLTSTVSFTSQIFHKQKHGCVSMCIKPVAKGP